MNQKHGNLFILLLFVAALAGAYCGWYFGPTMVSFKPFGDLFLNALKMLVVPLVTFSVIVGVSSLGDIRKVGVIGRKTLLYYFVTTGFSVLLGLFLVNLLQPGLGVEVVAGEIPQRAREGMKVSDLLLSFVHPNIVEAMAGSKILPIIVFSLLFGGILTTLGEKGRQFLDFCQTANDVIMKMVGLVILWLAPIGIFALVASKLGASGGGDAFFIEISKIGKYALTVVLGLGIHSIFVLPLLLFVFARRNPFKYAFGMLEALITAFSTGSSSSTLPVTMRNCREKNHVPEGAVDFVLPIGATVNMDGTALYEAVAAMFIAQSYGIELGFGEQMIIFFTATLASIGAAGIPQAGLVTMVLVLEAVGLPIEGIGIILAIDWFLDRLRTMVNVWGDSVGAAVIGRSKLFKL